MLHGAPHIEKTAGALRDSPGKAIISKPLHDTATLMRGSHGNAGLVPEIIGKRLEGREFKKFKEYREAFWTEVANSKYAAEFSPQSIGLMKKGRAPYVHESQIYQGREVFELHHIHPINQGGSVYDSSNIMITTPRFHREVLTREYHGIR